MIIRIPRTLTSARVKAVLRSRLALPLRALYGVLSAAYLLVVNVHDTVRGPRRTRADRAEVAERVTVTVKTFERPRVIRRFLRATRRIFDGRIVVADDSRVPLARVPRGIEVLRRPFNSGVAAGRNAALDQVTTEFVFVTDDDIVLTPLTDLAILMDYLDHNPEVDLVGVTLVDLPIRKRVDRGSSPLFPGARPPRIPWGTEIDGLRVQRKLAQVYLARTDSIRAVRWDEHLRMVDHRDFFSRASGVLVGVLHDRVLAYHVQTPFDAHYASFREDVADDLAYLDRKWSGESGDG